MSSSWSQVKSTHPTNALYDLLPMLQYLEYTVLTEKVGPKDVACTVRKSKIQFRSRIQE